MTYPELNIFTAAGLLPLITSPWLLMGRDHTGISRPTYVGIKITINRQVIMHLAYHRQTYLA